MAKPKILIVEDNQEVQEAFERLLGDKYHLLQAYSLTAGERMFNENGDVAAVLMDGNVDDVKGRSYDSHALSEKMHKRFPRLPIIAMSVFYADDQMKHGCTKSLTKDLGAPLIATIVGRIVDKRAA